MTLMFFRPRRRPAVAGRAIAAALAFAALSLAAGLSAGLAHL